MKPLIQFVFCTMLLLHCQAGATNNDSIACLELAGEIRYKIPGASTCKIELLEGNTVIRVLQTGDDRFCFRLLKNTQYSIKIYEGSCPVKQIFVNTNLPWEENNKAYRIMVAVDLHNNCTSFEEECKGSSGQVHFDPDAKAFFYNDKHMEAESEWGDFDITKPKY